MEYEVTLPELGEDSEDEAEVTFWLVEVGDRVTEGEDLVEMATDKAAFTVPSPTDGKVIEQLVQEGDIVSVGDVIAILEAG